MVRVVVVVVALLLLSGCEDGEPSAEATTGPAATDACGDVETFPIQGEGHLVGNQEPPVPYNSTPPTSGWHTSTDVPIMVMPVSDPLTEPEQVTVLERGGVVVTHGDLPDAQRERLAQLLSDQYSGQAALTAYDQLDDGSITLSAWGVLQRCDDVDPGAVETFIRHYTQR
jgi:hypothetical protein